VIGETILHKQNNIEAKKELDRTRRARQQYVVPQF